jgi:eukaryotic-like serine/threonine-protein kinase
MTEHGAGSRVLGGRYRLRSLLAVGGMGAVWVADDAVLGRQVAVKLLGEALAGDGLAAERLRREARAAARLLHPGVARVLDLGEDGGRPYLVMELLRGESLADRLARAGPLPPAEAVRVVAAAAEALQAAHQAGIVHRDVKPGNVFLTGDGEVKLLDFGIASAANEAALTGGGLIGTAAYLAPERMLGHHATPAADVYALGVLLYELLAGRPPFAADSGMALAMAHLHARAAPLRDAAPGVPPALAAACEQALAKDPAARPPSAAALARLLRSAVPRTPPAAAPPPDAAAPAPSTDHALTRRLPAAGAAPATVAGRRTRRRGARVAAALLLAALLAAGPSLGGLLPDGLGPARSTGRQPAGADNPAPADGQVPGGLGDPAPADGQAPGAGATAGPAGRPDAADRPQGDLGDQDDRDDGGSGEGGGGSSGPG